MVKTPFEARMAEFTAAHEAQEAQNRREWSELVERLRKRFESPEGRRAAQEYRRAMDEAEAIEARQTYERRLEGLSGAHVPYVRANIDRSGRPKPSAFPIWLDLAAQWDWSTWVFLVGPTGCGKTTAMTWAGMHWARHHGTVMHTTAARVCRAEGEHLAELRTCGLLLLDEVHRLGGLPAWQVAPVWDLIIWREEHPPAPIIAGGKAAAGNMEKLVGKEIKRRFPMRLSSRQRGA